jgi:hypothetical protein
MVRNVETPVAKMIISGTATEGTTITVDEKEGRLDLSVSGEQKSSFSWVPGAEGRTARAPA